MANNIQEIHELSQQYLLFFINSVVTMDYMFNLINLIAYATCMVIGALSLFIPEVSEPSKALLWFAIAWAVFGKNIKE